MFDGMMMMVCDGGGGCHQSKWQSMDAKVKASIIVDEQAASVTHSGTHLS